MHITETGGSALVEENAHLTRLNEILTRMVQEQEQQLRVLTKRCLIAEQLLDERGGDRTVLCQLREADGSTDGE